MKIRKFVTFYVCQVELTANRKWRTRVSIPVPSECESDALPLELVPHDT